MPMKYEDPWREAFWRTESQVSGRTFSENVNAAISAVVNLEREAILQSIQMLRRSGTPAEGILSIVENRCKFIHGEPLPKA